MTRRTFLAGAAAGVAAFADATAPRSRMGIAETALHPAKDTIAFLEWAHSLGAAGVQARLTSMDADYLRKLRARLEQLDMYLELMGDLPGFDRLAPAARQAGATVVRVVAPGTRRYEGFATLEDWRAADAAARKQIAHAIPVA